MKNFMSTRLFASFLLVGLALVESGLASDQPSLPPGARLRLGTLKFRHTGSVHAVGFPADGKTLMSSGGSEVIRWDLRTGKELCRRETGPLRAISPNGSILALASEDGQSISLVDMASNRKMGRLQIHKGKFLSAAFSAGGDTLVTGDGLIEAGLTRSVTIRLWQTASGKQLRAFKTSQLDVVSMGLSPDGKTLFIWSGEVNAELRVWDALSGKQTHKVDHVNVAVFGPNGGTIFAATGKGSKPEEFYRDVIALETATGKQEKLFQGSPFSISALALSPDGKTLAVAGYYDVVRLWDLASRKQVQSLPWVRGPVGMSYLRGPAYALAFSADGKILAAGGWGNTVRLWEWRSGRELFDEGHHAGVGSLVFSPDGRTLISRGRDDTIRLWEIAAGKAVQRFRHPQKDGTAADPIGAMLGSPDGKSIILGTWAGKLGILDLKIGKERPFKDPIKDAKPAAISADGKRLLTFPLSSHDRPLGECLTCNLWDLPRGQKIRHFTHAVKNDPKLPVSGGQMAAAAFAPDGKTIASAWVTFRHGPMYVKKAGHGVSLWDCATGEERRLDASATTLAFLDGGKTLACADGPGKWARSGNDPDHGLLQFWDVASGKKLREYKGPGHWDRGLVFSPDGKLFASTGGADDPTVYLWRTATGQQLKRFTGHRCEVRCLAFSPDGRTLASGSDDTTILLWEVQSWR
jgi:WD40 repeat protein